MSVGLLQFVKVNEIRPGNRHRSNVMMVTVLGEFVGDGGEAVTCVCGSER